MGPNSQHVCKLAGSFAVIMSRRCTISQENISQDTLLGAMEERRVALDEDSDEDDMEEEDEWDDE